MPTKPSFLTYVERETGVRKNKWLSGHRILANRPADTDSSLPSDRQLTVADNTRQKRRTGDRSAQWTRAVTRRSPMLISNTCVIYVNEIKTVKCDRLFINNVNMDLLFQSNQHSRITYESWCHIKYRPSTWEILYFHLPSW